MAEKILVIDDDVDTLKLVGLILQRQGYEVRVANSGAQALTILETDLPDLILLDIMMPEMDGYEVAKKLRTEIPTTDIPIIMFTAKSQLDDKVMGFEAGADDYLTKPTQPRELLAHIKAVLTRSTKGRKTGPIITPSSSERGFMIGVLGAKGGLGVSTIAVNLGIALRESHKKDVIIADFRPGQGSIGLELGYPKTEGLNRLLELKVNEISVQEIESQLVVHSSGVSLLLSSHRPSDSKYAFAAPHFEAIARQLPFLARHVVLDLGSSYTPTAEKVLPLCNEVIIVVEPVPHTITQSRLLLDELISSGFSAEKVTAVLINRYRSGVQLSWSQVQEQLKHNIAVIFTPANELTYQAAASGVPLFAQQPDSLTTQQFQKLAEKIVAKSGQ
jgi:pilus assembly protein CpaE